MINNNSITSSAPVVKRPLFKIDQFWDRFGMLSVFVGLSLICIIFVPNFGSMINMRGLGLAISMSGMIACAMLFFRMS